MEAGSLFFSSLLSCSYAHQKLTWRGVHFHLRANNWTSGPVGPSSFPFFRFQQHSKRKGVLETKNFFFIHQVLFCFFPKMLALRPLAQQGSAVARFGMAC